MGKLDELLKRDGITNKTQEISKQNNANINTSNVNTSSGNKLQSLFERDGIQIPMQVQQADVQTQQPINQTPQLPSNANFTSNPINQYSQRLEYSKPTFDTSYKPTFDSDYKLSSQNYDADKIAKASEVISNIPRDLGAITSNTFKGAIGKGALGLGDWLMETGDRVMSPVYNAADKLGGWLSGKTDEQVQQIISNRENAQQNAEDNIGKLQNKLDESIYNTAMNTSNPVARKVAEIAPSAGQSLASAAIGLANPALGLSTFGASAAGNYYRDKLNQGWEADKAYAYGNIMGTVEALTEAIPLGNYIDAIKTTGIKQAIGKFGLSTLYEALQEAIIEPIDTATSQIINNDYNKQEWEDLGNRMLESGIDGALMSLLMGGAGLGVKSSIEVLDNVIQGKQVSAEQVQQARMDSENALKENNNVLINDSKNDIINTGNILKGGVENVERNNTTTEPNSGTNRESNIRITERKPSELDGRTNLGRSRQYILDANDIISKSKEENINAVCVDRLDNEENKNVLISNDGMSTVSIKDDGDIIGVTRLKSGNKEELKNLIYQAIQMGGNKLDCYGENLVNAYAQYGFEPVSRVPYSQEVIDDFHADEKEKWNEYNKKYGKPDVYAMMNTGKVRKYTIEDLNNLPSFDYDEAMKYRDDLLENQQNGSFNLQENNTINNINNQNSNSPENIEIERDNNLYARANNGESISVNPEKEKIKNQKLADDIHFGKKLEQQKNRLVNKINTKLAEVNIKNQNKIQKQKDKYKYDLANQKYNQKWKEAEQKLADDIYYGQKLERQKNKLNEQSKTKLVEMKIKNQEKIKNQKTKSDYTFANYKYNQRWQEAKNKLASEIQNAWDKIIDENKNIELKDKAEAKKIKNSIYNEFDELSKKTIGRQTKKNNLLENFKEPVAEILSQLDVSKTDKNTKTNLNLSNVIKKLEDLSDSTKFTTEEYKDLGLTTPLVLDTELLDGLKKVDGIAVRDMTLEELTTIDNLLKSIKHQSDMANKTFINNKKMAVDEIINKSRETTDKYKDKAKEIIGVKGLTEHITGLLRPKHFWKQVGLDIINDASIESEEKQISIIRQGADFYQKAKNEMSKEAQKEFDNNKPHNIILENGEKITLTTKQILNLYQYMKDLQAQNHILKGGIKPEKIKNILYNFNQRNTKITENDINTIEKQISPELFKFADKLGEYTNTVLKEETSKQHIKTFGYDKNGKDFYWSLAGSINSNQLNKDFSKENATGGLPGITKDRKTNASQGIVLRDIDSSFFDYLNTASTYVGWTDTLETLKKIRNYKRDIDSNEYNFAENIEMKMGAKVLKVIDNFINITNKGIDIKSNGLFDKLFGIQAGANVTFNISTMFKQPIAIVKTIYNDLNPKYIASSLNGLSNKSVKEMQKYSNIAYLKSQGYSETNMARSIKDIANNDFTPIEKAKQIGALGMELGDERTWSVIWEACKKEYSSKNKKPIKNFVEEDFKNVAKRFNDIIYETQVVDSPIHKSDTIKNANGFQKLVYIYQNETTSLISMISDAMWEAKYNKNYSKLPKAITAVAANVALEQMISNLISNYRHPDDDEKELFNITDFLINLLTMDPYINKLKSVVESATGYKDSPMYEQPITDLIAKFNKVKDNETKSETKSRAIIDLLEQIVTTTTGINVSNFERDFVEAPLKQYLKYSKDYETAYKVKKFETKPANSTALSDYYKFLAEAKNELSSSKYKSIQNDFIEYRKKYADKPENVEKQVIKNVDKKLEDLKNK